MLPLKQDFTRSIGEKNEWNNIWMCSWCKILFISLKLSLQFFSSLRGKKESSLQIGRITAIKCSAKHHICCIEVCNSTLPAHGSSPNMKLQDLFPINFLKLLQTVLFVTQRKKAAIKVRYLSDFVTKSFKTSDFHYSHHCLSF